MAPMLLNFKVFVKHRKRTEIIIITKALLCVATCFYILQSIVMITIHRPLSESRQNNAKLTQEKTR